MLTKKEREKLTRSRGKGKKSDNYWAKNAGKNLRETWTSFKMLKKLQTMIRLRVDDLRDWGSMIECLGVDDWGIEGWRFEVQYQITCIKTMHMLWFKNNLKPIQHFNLFKLPIRFDFNFAFNVKSNNEFFLSKIEKKMIFDCCKQSLTRL